MKFPKLPKDITLEQRKTLIKALQAVNKHNTHTDYVCHAMLDLETVAGAVVWNTVNESIALITEMLAPHRAVHAWAEANWEPKRLQKYRQEEAASEAFFPAITPYWRQYRYEWVQNLLGQLRFPDVPKMRDPQAAIDALKEARPLVARSKYVCTALKRIQGPNSGALYMIGEMLENCNFLGTWLWINRGIPNLVSGGKAANKLRCEWIDYMIQELEQQIEERP